jgi:hypothetical protein
MSKLVINGAKLKCSQGSSPGTLTVLPTIGTDADEQPMATENDYRPMVNVGSFGMCQTQVNPQVAAATAAAQGVLTPQPCVPVITSAWSPSSSVVTIQGTAALQDDSKCNCSWTGSIEITDPGTAVEID